MSLDYTKINIFQDALVALLNNEYLSDIKFIFPDGRIIFAHSFVLCCRSNGFCESFKTTFGAAKLIEVQNYSFDEYLQFLNYLYTDTCQIEDVNAAELVRELSKEHKLPELEKKCTNVISRGANDAAQVCATLERAIILKCEILIRKSLEFIAKNYFACLGSATFLKINAQTLSMILKLDPVSENDELNIYEFVSQWTTQACLAEGLPLSTSLKRAKLGDNLKLIRFGAMTVAEFTKCQDTDPDILSKDERAEIIGNIVSGTMGPSAFLNRKRLLLGEEEPARSAAKTTLQPTAPVKQAAHQKALKNPRIFNDAEDLDDSLESEAEEEDYDDIENQEDSEEFEEEFEEEEEELESMEEEEENDEEYEGSEDGMIYAEQYVDDY